MARKIDSESAIQNAINVHGVEYTYNDTEYSGSKGPFTVTCKKHGNWTTSYSSHVTRGSRCPKCVRKTQNDSRRVNLVEFNSRHEKVHTAGHYDLSKVQYSKIRDKVIVHCNICEKDFNIIGENFLSGQGCYTCGQKKKGTTLSKNIRPDFVYEAEKLNGNLYDYSEAIYVRSNVPVKIKCNRCDMSFLQTPNCHLAGQGCASCNGHGYKQQKPGIFYILQDGNITKIGITNKSAEYRRTNINRTSGKSFQTIFYVKFENGLVTLNVETDMLRLLKKQYKQPSEVYDGCCESFYNVSMESLMKNLCKVIQKHIKE